MNSIIRHVKKIVNTEEQLHEAIIDFIVKDKPMVVLSMHKAMEPKKGLYTFMATYYYEADYLDADGEVSVTNLLYPTDEEE